MHMWSIYSKCVGHTKFELSELVQDVYIFMMWFHLVKLLLIVKRGKPKPVFLVEGQLLEIKHLELCVTPPSDLVNSASQNSSSIFTFHSPIRHLSQPWFLLFFPLYDGYKPYMKAYTFIIGTVYWGLVLGWKHKNNRRCNI